MPRLGVLFLQPDFSGYRSSYYQHQFYEALARVHRVFAYGPGFPDYDSSHTIDDVLALCLFDPDVICIGAGWERDNHPTEFDIHPSIRPGEVSIPSVMILNKEYKKFDQKIAYIKSNKIRGVFTVHHSYSHWAAKYGVNMIHFPFAVDENTFTPGDGEHRRDFGFSGNLHTAWTPVRAAIRKKLFYTRWIKRRKYWGTRIYWGDRNWGGMKSGAAYASLINSSRIWLATPSAIDIVGTRFTEVMASCTLLMCNESQAYAGLFSPGEHCVTFQPDLSDFDDVLFRYLEDEEERHRIARAGYQHVLANHTWARRVEQWTERVLQIIG